MKLDSSNGGTVISKRGSGTGYVNSLGYDQGEDYLKVLTVVAVVVVNILIHEAL